jgi:HK97 family phage prohead protease
MLTWMELDDWKRKIAKGVRPLEAAVRKSLAGGVSVVDDAARTVKFVISDGNVDRDKDIVSPKGWQLDDFRKNPVVVWAHDYTQPPIGRATSIGLEGDKLVMVAEFQPKALNPFADTIYRMIKGDWLKGSSVGFKPRDFDYNTERKGVDFHGQDLLEVSVVPIPSNPSALSQAKAAGVDYAPVRRWAVKALLIDGKAAGGAMGEGDHTGHRQDGHSLGAGDETRDTAGCELGQLCPKRVNEPCPMAEGCVMGKGASGIANKRGRVISAKNEAELRGAIASIDRILGQLQPAEPDLDDAGAARAGEAVKAIERAVAKQVKERDGEFDVVDEDTGKVTGTYASRDEAEEAQFAQEAAKHKAIAARLAGKAAPPWVELADDEAEKDDKAKPPKKPTDDGEPDPDDEDGADEKDKDKDKERPPKKPKDDEEDFFDMKGVSKEELGALIATTTKSAAQSWLTDRTNRSRGRVD